MSIHRTGQGGLLIPFKKRIFKTLDGFKNENGRITYKGEQIRIKVQMSDVDGVYTRTLLFPKRRTAKNEYEWVLGLYNIAGEIMTMNVGDKLIGKHLRNEESVCIITRIG